MRQTVLSLCTADGIVVVEHTSKAAIQVQSLKKAELITELTKRGIQGTGNVNELQGMLKAQVDNLKAKYCSEQKRTDVLQLNTVCSGSAETLFVSSNTKERFTRF